MTPNEQQRQPGQQDQQNPKEQQKQKQQQGQSDQQRQQGGNPAVDKSKITPNRPNEGDQQRASRFDR
ncbi:hypothetical protein [Polaromonas jejuensis]|uniref:Uncharacterized protein n=1 Tax=Polaromonas jejuensis TaxID=457502 RepID=A0ABW0QDV6_9BURK|nr:hypothetical protein [Polaromonas jejuensis]